LKLTEEQMDFIIRFVVYFTFTVGVVTIIREVLRLVKYTVKKIYHGIRRMGIRRQIKSNNGYKNFEDNTWYADGTVYRADQGKFEKADYEKPEQQKNR